MRRLVLTVAACALGGAALAFSVSPGGLSLGMPVHAEETFHTCPMHPQIIEPEPGTCPICGMDLVVKRSGPPAAAPGQAAPSPADGPGGAVVIDPVVVQNMGVRVAHVARGSVGRRIRTLGEVEVAEDHLSVVNLRFSGWIERIWVDETGQAVKKGQALFQIYSPEVVAAQEEYLLAVNTSGKGGNLAKAAARRLRL